MAPFDPVLIGEVQAFKEPVVCELALQLRQCPPACPGHVLQPSGECAAKRDRRAVGRAGHASCPRVMLRACDQPPGCSRSV